MMDINPSLLVSLVLPRRMTPEAMRITRERVNAETILRLDLAPGGGQAIAFRPIGR